MHNQPIDRCSMAGHPTNLDKKKKQREEMAIASTPKTQLFVVPQGLACHLDSFLGPALFPFRVELNG